MAKYLAIRRGFAPPLGRRQTAFVGQVMYQEFEYHVQLAAKTAEPVLVSLDGPTVRVPAHAVIPGVWTGGEAQFCTEFHAYHDRHEQAIDIACFLDTHLRGVFEWARAPRIHGSQWHRVPAVAYELQDLQAHAHPVEGGFETALVYHGMANNVLHVAYSESVDHRLLPGFPQPMQYPLQTTAPTFIRFKNIAFEIFSADNKSVEYRIISR
jgi:hypothetical protein